MMSAAPKRRPMGLAARAVALVVGLLALTAIGATLAVWCGVERENERNQMALARNLVDRFAASTESLFAQRGAGQAAAMVDSVAATRTDLRLLSLRDAQGRQLSHHQGPPAVQALEARNVAAALASGKLSSARGADGVLAVTAPLIENGRVAGVLTIIWNPDTFRFNALLALTPFFLFLGGLMLVAIPLALYLVRSSVAPLDTLTKFAEMIAERGEGRPIDLKTGDEFETLANAFNHMLTRLDSSMRRLQEVAFVDSVTQLPNQTRFENEVNLALLRGAQGPEIAAVMVLELQRLPRMLQMLDPDATRDLMRTIAERITIATRTVDRLVRVQDAAQSPASNARLGTTDFAALAPGLASPADALRFAQHLTAALNQPFAWRGHKLSLGAVCGVALAPRDGDNADSMIRHARMALQAAQETPARIKVFSPSIDREAMARLMLEREMRTALENNEFRAYFQPKVNLKTGKVEGAEALARWVRPDRTIISPGRFIPVAEESGLIGPLSDAIMREACWKGAAWARAGMPINIAVNVSALQFRNDRFAEHVLQILRSSGMSPHCLELEITETVAMEDPERALRLIQPLRAAGVRLAIDDFGCGHSSLAALSKLPFDVIKIDQQFVRALERTDPQAEAIVEMILALAQSLKLEVVAEGVERHEQVQFMAERGCHWIQGFVYGAAVSASEFGERLRAQAAANVVAIHAA